MASSLIFIAYAFARSREPFSTTISATFIAGGHGCEYFGLGGTRRRGGDWTCIWGGGGRGGDSDRRASGLDDRLLDLDDRDGVRGREENRLRLVSALNALGASVFCFSSSDPPRMLLGGSDGKCDTLEDDEAAETEGERESDAA